MSEIEKLEAEIAMLRERISDQDDSLRYGEGLCARLVAERDEARRERDEALSRVAAEAGKDLAAWAADLDAAEAAHARVVAERDEARHSCRMLRQYLVEVVPWVGVCPLDPDAIHDMALARDLASDALAERTTWSTTPSTGGAAGVASVLAELSHRVGHPSDSTR